MPLKTEHKDKERKGKDDKNDDYILVIIFALGKFHVFSH